MLMTAELGLAARRLAATPAADLRHIRQQHKPLAVLPEQPNGSHRTWVRWLTAAQCQRNRIGIFWLL